MILYIGSSETGQASIPRESGDDPVWVLCSPLMNQYSPRERG